MNFEIFYAAIKHHLGCIPAWWRAACMWRHVYLLWYAAPTCKTVSNYMFHCNTHMVCDNAFNPSSPGQNSRLFADDIFICIFMNEKFCILVKISLKFVPKGLIDNKPAMVKIMAWCRMWGFLWWAPSAKTLRKDHHRVSSGWSSTPGAVLGFIQILAYLVHNMSRSQLYLGFGHFGWLPSFFGP